MHSKNHSSFVLAIGLSLIFTISLIGASLIPAFSQEVVGGVCPSENIQHWEKIDFVVISPDVAKKFNVSADTELNIKVVSDTNSIEDIKQKVIDFSKVNATESDKASIQILGTNYDVICAQ